MGKIGRPRKVRLFASIIFHREADLEAVLRLLGDTVGPVEEKTPPALFTHTTYYNREMGEGLMRSFVIFSPLVDREVLPDVKISTNATEDLFAKEGKRTVNIDSGYIALEHVILATTKGYAHRVYLGKGIHADLTLMFNSGSYRALEWTYPDYAEEQTIALFNRWRDLCKESLRTSARTDPNT
ncbi:MAG: hypothetical protein A4E60_01531 [Syntrophorhabdus sp. PtaB.Bin047]|jgi:hypothetical protein|nr:MAG: hypothetical protein A4E60_01531 [Syntrophorhabdus sp. PtaB.Bin047]